MGAALWIGPVIVAAVIAGLINVVGWFVTLRHTRRLEQERRAEKVTDTQTAILAEIRSDLTTLNIDVAKEVAATRERLAAAPDDKPYTPFVPKDSGAIVFSAIVSEIAVLRVSSTQSYCTTNCAKRLLTSPTISARIRSADFPPTVSWQ